MGQVQRRRQQDIELWELYEEEGSGARRGGRGRNAGRDNHRAGRSSEYGGGRRTAADRNGRRTDRRREAGRGGQSVRRTQAGEGVSIRLYEMGRDRSKPGNRAPLTVDRHASGTVRQSGNTARARRTGRARDVSGISYIGASPTAEARRRNSRMAYRGNARPVQSIRRRRARRRREILSKLVIALFMVTCLAMIYFITGEIYRMTHRNKEEKPIPVTAEQTFSDSSSDTGIAPPEIVQDLLEVNEYSRPGDKLSRINNIFVHYTANPGTSAAQNRSYFANLAETHERSASAHLIIGYDGELIQCIPFDEQAYAVMTRNEDSISIECCYLSDDGSFTQETYDTLIHTLAWLLDKYDLTVEDILRHYDCGGKLCPLYYAENEGAWDKLRQDVEAYLAQAKQESA